MEYKELSRESIIESINQFRKGFPNNNLKNIPFEMVIEQNNNYFSVKVGGMMTGIGGFSLILDNFNSLDLIKVEYNGIILNNEQKQELFNKYKKHKNEKRSKYHK